MIKKSKILIALMLGLTGAGFAQNHFNQYSIEGGYGFNYARNPELNGFNHFDLGFRYMANEYWGAKADYGYDMFKSKDGLDNNTTLNRVSVQAVYNIGRLLSFNDIASRTFNVLLHGGAGITILKTEPGETDKLGNFIIGGTAQFYVSPQFALTGDVSGIINFKQNYGFNGVKTPDEFTGKMLTVSAGITYYFGRNKSTSDWR
ncbi:outer membrane beta-barrel protein [Flavobacterium psychrotrophum]|uniref:outer membrane beta-barrel protein n=1 Tax=Flavobacterium psychrotrophum TaxID=2294119 RepID=UPI000E3229A5|nr:outer membrane beta-barrel protein [Flavobacterium psychrotrophum]